MGEISVFASQSGLSYIDTPLFVGCAFSFLGLRYSLRKPALVDYPSAWQGLLPP
jgi:hypothetical protein